jgi:3-mercaptopyruvate sulfurtransferase SseA
MGLKKTLLLVFLALALAGSALCLTRPREVQPREATWEEVQAEARRGGYRLVSTEELAKLYRQEPRKLLLVDTRQDWEYRSGHIEGAVNFPLEPTWWGRFRARGPLEKLLGPDKDRAVVFY